MLTVYRYIIVYIKLFVIATFIQFNSFMGQEKKNQETFVLRKIITISISTTFLIFSRSLVISQCSLYISNFIIFFYFTVTIFFLLSSFLFFVKLFCWLFRHIYKNEKSLTRNTFSVKRVCILCILQLCNFITYKYFW